MSYNIAIDGPAGAGKSTIAKLVAKKRGYIYVDTGAMYRAMALYLLRTGVDTSDRAAIAKACQNADISIAYQKGEQVVLLNGENVNAYLRTEEVGNMASVSSAVPEVRKKLVELQQELAAKEDVVMDGRDIGTHVLPQAPLKIYLTASVEARALRRYKELLEKGNAAELEAVKADIAKRDASDMNREISPLKQADDAVYLDTSHMDIPQVVEKIIAMYQERSQSREE